MSKFRSFLMQFFSKHILLFLCCSFMIAGCGYHVGDILSERTIAVPIFHNETLYRGYEFSLTRSVISELMTTTALHVVELDQADTILYGKIHKIEQNTIAKDENRKATELDVIVQTDIRWVKADGTEILPSTSISETMQIEIQQGQTIPSAIQDSLQRLSRKIVANLEHPFWKKDDTLAEKSVNP